MKNIDSVFDIPSIPDQYQYDLMIKKSQTAIECVEAYNQKDLNKYSKLIVELVKIGYCRDEMNSFINILLKDNV